MVDSRLKYVSTRVEEELRKSVPANIARYLAEGFEDLALTEGWAVPLSIMADLEPLSRLITDTGPEAEVLNSLLVWQSLRHLTPSLASEGRIWTRLTHVEALPYARARWIGSRAGAAAVQAIELHLFGATHTQRRDDNAVGRLWWNAYIAKQALPDQHHDALKALLRSADIRSNVVERAWSTSRPCVAGAVLRAIMREPAITAAERTFREFMKAVNRRGGGVMFELMDQGSIDAFMDQCSPTR